MLKKYHKVFEKPAFSFGIPIRLLVAWICFGLFSCSSDEDRIIEGTWSIDIIHYKNYEFSGCLATNILDFEDELCFFPEVWSCDELTDLERNGSWKLVSSDSVPLKLIIESKNDLFSGSYRAVFEEDWEQKLLRLTLISDKTFVSLRKGLFDFEKDIGKYRRIIEYSQQGLVD